MWRYPKLQKRKETGLLKPEMPMVFAHKWPALNGEHRRNFTSSVFPSIGRGEELVHLESKFVLFKALRQRHFLTIINKSTWRICMAKMGTSSKQRKSVCSVSIRFASRNSSIKMLVELPIYELSLPQSGDIVDQCPWRRLQFTE